MIDLHKTKGLSRSLLGLSCFLLSSCAVDDTNFAQSIESAVPSTYGAQANTQSKLITESFDQKSNAYDIDFYRQFKDEKLNSMIERALKSNYDMRTAYLNLKQAEIEYKLAGVDAHPSVNASINSSWRKDLDNQSKNITRGANGSLGVSYEVDLFNRLGALQTASLEHYQATAWDYKAMRLAIIERVCNYYWQYAYANDALNMAQEQLADSQKRLELIKVKVANGAADGLDYDRALVNHRNVEQNIYQRGYELNTAHNALSTILNLATETNLHQNINLDALSKTQAPQIALTLPAELLKNRPDLMSAEAKLRAAVANTQAADAAFYPSFNLNASLQSGGNGTNGEDLTKFFINPVAALAGAITFPFFNYNELKLKKESTLVAQEKAMLDFSNTFIEALKEVSDAIHSLNYQEQLIKSTASEYKLTRSNYERLLERYTAGAAALSDVLDASDSLRTAQMKYLGAKRELLNSSMHLFVTLGGDSIQQQTPIIRTNTEDAMVS